MKICLKTQAKRTGQHHMRVNLRDRLPTHVHAPCELDCDYQVELNDSYYLLTVHARGQVDVLCQRCLQPFSHQYDNTSKIAISDNEERAQALMEQYECLVSTDHQLDFIELLTDELHLFVPEKHSDLGDCNSEVSHLIRQER